jgi:hypothetical protein
MAESRRARKIIVYEFEETSIPPFDVFSSRTFVRKIAEPSHENKASDKVDRIFVLLLICGFEEV